MQRQGLSFAVSDDLLSGDVSVTRYENASRNFTTRSAASGPAQLPAGSLPDAPACSARLAADVSAADGFFPGSAGDGNVRRSGVRPAGLPVRMEYFDSAKCADLIPVGEPVVSSAAAAPGYDVLTPAGAEASFTVAADSVSRSAAGDVLLPGLMPEVEYMYGCSPTALAMLLGYYDLYGYDDADYSNIVEGDVDVHSRGSDGNIYNMNEFDSVLGRLVASRDYVERFYERDGRETTPEQELPYTFVGGGVDGGVSQVDISLWNCLADYLGTGQYWRGNPNTGSTFYLDVTLNDILSWYETATFKGDGYTRELDLRFTSSVYGINLYVESRGYSLDGDRTGTFYVDGCGGSFTFEDYMREIDAGRPVLIGTTSHSMVGYGYNKDTREIIFDDTYFSNQRMAWNGIYNYGGSMQQLIDITVITLEGGTPGGSATGKLVISKAYNEMVESERDVVVRATGSIVADGPAALRLLADNLTVTLEGGSLSGTGSSGNAAISFVNSTVPASGSVFFTGGTVSLSSRASGVGSAAGIAGYGLTVRFSESAAGAAGISIKVGTGTGAGRSYYGIQADGGILKVNGDFGGVIEVDGDHTVFSAMRSAQSYVLYGGSVQIGGKFGGTLTARSLANSAASGEIPADAGATGIFARESVSVTGTLSGSWIVRAAGGSDNAASGGTATATGVRGSWIDIFAMDAKMEVRADGSGVNFGAVASGIDAEFTLRLDRFTGSLNVIARSEGGEVGGNAYAVSGREIIGNFGGTVIANGSDDSCAIRAETSLQATVTGTLFSGAWNRPDELPAKLRNFRTYRNELLAATRDRYAISAGGDAQLAFDGTALVLGGISIDSGSLNFSANASVYGDLVSARSVSMNISLRNTQSNHVFLTAGQVSSTLGTITVDADGADFGSYTLVDSAAYAAESVTLAGSFGKVELSVGASHAVGNTVYTLIQDDTRLRLSIEKGNEPEDPDDPGSSGLVMSGRPSVSVRNGVATISWEPATGEGSVYGYSIRVNEKTYFSSSEHYSVALAYGNYTCSVQAIERDGGRRSKWSEEKVFMVGDTEAPVLSFDPSSSVNGSEVTISWMPGTDNIGVEGYLLKIGDREYSVNGTSFTVALGAGEYSYTLRAFDACGNLSEPTTPQSFRIADVESPVFADLPNVSIYGRSFTISWKPAEDNVGVAGYEVTVNGVTYQTGLETSFTLSGQAAGDYSYQVTARDAAGNAASTELRSFTLEEGAPDRYFRKLSGELSAASPAVSFGSFPLLPGWYTLAGDFSGLNAKISVVDERGKTVGKASVKNGVLNFKKPLLLDGACSIRVDSSDKGKSSGDFSLELSGSVFTKGDNSDDEISRLTDAHRITVGDSAGSLISGEWVGYGDAVDYRAVTFGNAGKYTFSINATDAAKLTVWTLRPNGRLKALKKVSVKAGTSGGIAGLLLDAGTYYLSVESTTAKKGGSADYDVSLDGASTFFTKGDNNDDEIGRLTDAHRITVGDTAVSLISGEWVGYGDAVDYRAVTFGNAGKYTFSINATDAAKLTVWTLRPNGRLKALKKVSVKAGTSGGIAGLLLDAGTYYLSVESTTAKKGGSADYDVSLDGASTFFTKGDNRDDDPGALPGEFRTALDGNGGRLIDNGWVGYGDAVDYRELEVTRAGTYTFTLSGAVDAVKLTLFSEDETGKRRKLKSVSVKNGSGSIEALELGTELRYLAAVESSTAKKGGGTDYSLDFACLPPSASASADLDSWRSSSAALDCYEQPSLPGPASELSAAGCSAGFGWSDETKKGNGLLA